MKVLSTLEPSAHMQSVVSKVHYGGAKLPTEDEPAQIAGVIRMGEDDDDVKPLKLESVQSGGRSHEARVVSKPKKKSSNFIKNAFRQTNQGKKLNMIEISCEKVGVNHVRIDGQTCLDMGTAAYLDLTDQSECRTSKSDSAKRCSTVRDACLLRLQRWEA